MRRALSGIVFVSSLPFLFGAFTSAAGPREMDRTVLSRRGELQYHWAREHLRAPFEGYGPLDDLGVSAFDVILLSNLASGLMNVSLLSPERAEELAILSEEVASRALSDDVAPRGVREGQNVGEHNLYASHLLLILGIEHHLLAAVGRESRRDDIALGVARHLRSASLAHPTAHARSYPGSARWPADQSVTLAALALHDREHGSDLAGEPIARWLRWLHAHETEGLPWSATSGLSYTEVPRGCALSFLSIYVGRFAPDEGARIYQHYRRAHGIDWLGVRGFREWPVGSEGGSDVDAGPVLLGWGTAATGIGLGAARLYDDREMAAGIERMADLVGLGVPASGRYLLAPTLGQAMLFSGTTETPWDVPTPEVGSRNTGWPILSSLFLVATALSSAWLARGLRRRHER